MKKTILLILAMVMVFCSSCKNTKNSGKTIEPEETQMKSICELATMDCYYHNVAKYMEEDAEGILWWKKDKNFWIEYAGVVTIGINASLVSIEVSDDRVTITMPPAKVLGCKVDETTLSEDSFIIAKNSAKIDAQTQTEAFKDAQKKMEETASADTALLANAQQRAQKLLEDYVNNIGNSIGKQYKIKWVYVEDTSTPASDVDAEKETLESISEDSSAEQE